MRLHWSPRSPFVRKLMVAMHELGIADKAELVRSVVAMTQPNAEVMKDNPLNKLPTLVLDNGRVLYDSRVIVEYLDGIYGPKLIPTDFDARIEALRRQALGDGFLDFMLLWRNERDRPAELQSPPHLAAYRKKWDATLKALDEEAAALGKGALTIGHISIACSLSYLDFRFNHIDWRKDHPRIAAWHRDFCERPAMKITEPVDDS